MTQKNSEDGVLFSLMDQTDTFTIRACEAVCGVRTDVGAMALITAAFIATRRQVELVEAEDVEKTVTELIELTVSQAREYSKALVAEGTIQFPKTPRIHDRSDTEKRMFGFEP